MKMFKKFVYTSLTVTVTVAVALGIVKGFDYLLWRSALNGPNQVYYQTLAKNDMKALPMQQMYWYPYTGAHIAPNTSYYGPIPLESTEFYDKMEFKSGKHGFFIEIDIDNPPGKTADEFRIILIGGSSAQGWGAEHVLDMLYKTLPKTLNERFKEQGKDIFIRVINLAMAGSITYQNYIALNVWGHKLEPDLILSYSGGNDLLVPHSLRSDAPMGWSATESYIRSQHIDALGPNYLQWARWFPGIIHTTFVGRMMRFQALSKSPTTVEADYAEARGYQGANVVRDIAIPQYVKAFKSIKRDFDGIPIMIVFQPIDFRMLPDSQQLGEEYSEMIEATIAECRDFKNDKWYFVNMREYWNENKLWRKGRLGNGLHLPTIFQKIVSDQIAKALEPIILKLRSGES